MADQDLKYRILTSVVGAQAIDNLKKSVDGVGKSTESLNKQFGFASGAIKAFGAAFTATAAIAYVKSLINIGDELQALSEKTGVAANQLYGFKIAASTANLSFEGLQGGLVKFSKAMGEVKLNNQEVIGAFKSVGVAATDQNGKLRQSGDVIIDLAKKFEKLKDGPEKTRIAIALFGKAGADMVPFLNQGASALEEFSNVFDEGFARRADAFNDSLAILGAKIQVIGINAADSLLPALQEITSAFASLPSDGKEAIGFFDVLGEAARITAAVIYEIYVSFKDVIDTATTGFREMKALVSGDFAEIDRLAAGLADRQKKLQENELKFYEKIGKNSLLFGDGSVEDIKARARAENTPAAKTGGAAPDISAASRSIQSEADAIKKFIAVQNEQITQEREKLDLIGKSRVEVEKFTEAKKLDLEVTKASANFSEAGKKQYLEAAEAIKEQRLALIELQQAQRETYSTGIKEALTDYVDGVKDVASQTKKLMTDAFSGMEDALVKFVSTGKLSFHDLAMSIIEDIARIAIRQGITGPIASALSSAFGGGGAGFSFAGATNTSFNANGGIVGPWGSAQLKQYAAGGIARSPQISVFGEGSTPEAYVPLPDGRSIPVSMKGGSGDVFNISVNVQDGGATQTQGNSSSGAELGKAISAAVQAELIKQRRPGGMLA
jgi:lambda family phage tail tape measure protein